MLIEDHQGIIWIATHLGLLRFDGLQTTVFLPQKGNPNSLSNEYITYLYEDPNHYLWIATRNGLTSLDPSRKIFKRYLRDSRDEGTLPNNRVYNLLPDTDSTFFICCDRSGLSSFNIRTGRVVRLDPK
jgi:ligand-binding sensor domain-containing protein